MGWGIGPLQARNRVLGHLWGQGDKLQMGALLPEGATEMCIPWPKRLGVMTMLPAVSCLHRSLWECGKDVSLLFVSAGPFFPRVWLRACGWIDG